MTKKANETSKSIFRNVIYGFLAWFFPLILSFVATPIIVKSLGNEEYGIYALVLGFISYSFNFSFGRAVTKYIAEFRVKGENDKINEIISAAFFINLPVGLIGLFFILLFSNWLVADVFNITVNLRQKSQNAFYLAGFTIFLATITQVFTAVLQGLQRYDVYTKIFNFYNIFLVLGNLLLAYFDYDLLWLFSWNLFATSLSCVLFFTALKKLLPNFTLTFRFKREIFKLVLNFSWGVIGYQIISNFLLLFERSWITRQLGSENLTIYVVPMMLAVYIHSFIASLMMVIFPLASELEQNKEKLLRLYQKSTKIVVMLVVFMSMTLILEGKIFLMLWINAEFAEKATSLLTIHTITFGLTAITVVVWYMTEGLGYPNYNFFVFMICLTISISGMFLLTENYGNFGIAIARLAGFGTIFFSIFYVEKWFFKQIQIRFWSKILLIIGISAVIAGSLNKFLISVFSVNWLTFALSVVFSGIVYLICLWFLKFLTTDEKLIFKRIFNK